MDFGKLVGRGLTLVVVTLGISTFTQGCPDSVLYAPAVLFAPYDRGYNGHLTNLGTCCSGYRALIRSTSISEGFESHGSALPGM